MDIETRFISSLLYSGRNQQELFLSRNIPKGIFTLREAEMAWVLKFRASHGKFPSPVAFSERFREKLREQPDPLASTLQSVLDMSMFTQMSAVNAQAKKMLEEGKPVQDAMQVFKRGAERLQAFNYDSSDIKFKGSSGALSRYTNLVRSLNNDGFNLIDTPWPTLNKLMKFFRPGEVIVFAARTSLGKTWTVIELVNYWASKGLPCLFFSKEMPGETVEDRFEAMRFGLHYDKFRAGDLLPRELRDWRRRRKDFNAKDPLAYPLFICGDDTIEGVGFSFFAQKLDQYKPMIGIIDGAYLLHPEGLSRNASAVERLTEISNRAKAVAKAKKIVMVVVVQVNRRGEKSSGMSGGGLGDIYGSDAWGQDADGVLIVKGMRGSNRRVIELAKGRESAIGDFTIEYRLDPPSFKEVRSAASSSNVGNQSVSFNRIK